ncbi:MAG: hypothetical protein AAF468_21115 [Pseudomonadota bacterium]
MSSMVKSILNGLMSVLAPIILIGGGALLTGWGATNGWTPLIWTGLIVVGAGLLWGAFAYFYD